MSTKRNAKIQIPRSDTSVSVKIIDPATLRVASAAALFNPPPPGMQHVPPSPSFSFLIEHPSGQKLLFDLSIPRDVSVLGPLVAERIRNSGHQMDVPKDVAEVLEEHGIQRSEINAIIWSHIHWDHKGDVAGFPPETDLVFGPGVTATFLGDAGGNSGLGGVLEREVKGRNVREINFQGPQCLRIGQLHAFDYFNDGSFYLLDTPGHCVGHLCALARTTVNPPSFIFLAGDAAHHCAEFRPSDWVPLPSEISPNPLTGAVAPPYCPGSFFSDFNAEHGRALTGPITQPAWGADMEVCLQTIGHMQEFDGDEDVLVLIAHDATARDSRVPQFPHAVNDWKERGLGRDLKWAWIGHLKDALVKVE